MLYKLIYFFHTDFSWLNVFRYITFRTILSTLTALMICFFLGGWVINRLRNMQVAQYIRDDGPPNLIS
jgi:phospho-N-acetylmuramoyl-pentapeptide-transferase